MNVFSKLNIFILENDFDGVIVYCALGMSRSPAIMICISRILGCYEMEKIVRDNFKFYNRVIVNYFDKFDYIPKNVMLQCLFCWSFKK